MAGGQRVTATAPPLAFSVTPPRQRFDKAPDPRLAAVSHANPALVLEPRQDRSDLAPAVAGGVDDAVDGQAVLDARQRMQASRLHPVTALDIGDRQRQRQHERRRRCDRFRHRGRRLRSAGRRFGDFRFFRLNFVLKN